MGDRRGQVNGEKAAGKATRPHPRQVELALTLTGQPDRLARIGVEQEAEEDVVMAVENRGHGR